MDWDVELSDPSEFLVDLVVSVEFGEEKHFDPVERVWLGWDGDYQRDDCDDVNPESKP